MIMIKYASTATISMYSTYKLMSWLWKDKNDNNVVNDDNIKEDIIIESSTSSSPFTAIKNNNNNNNNNKEERIHKSLLFPLSQNNFNHNSYNNHTIIYSALNDILPTLLKSINTNTDTSYETKQLKVLRRQKF